MQGIHYRVERNPLTKPASYRLRFILQGTAGYDEVAARVAVKNPGSSTEQIRNHLRSAMEELLGINISASQPFVKDMQAARQLGPRAVDREDSGHSGRRR